MRTRLFVPFCIVLTLASLTIGLAAAQGPRTQAPIGTAFLYQGRLNAGGSPAEGTYDFKFTLYDAATSGNPIGSPVSKVGVTVTRGLFAVELDFGDVFSGQAAWLEVAVKGPGDATFTTLSPRQALLPTPYALYATRAADANTAGALTTEAGGVRLEPGGIYDGGPNVIGGFAMNDATSGAYGATIGGGGGQLKLPPDVGYWVNTAGNYATVGGGAGNEATGANSTVSGGFRNRATESWATVGGGSHNSATDQGATVAGGGHNTAAGGDAFVGGGFNNSASRWYATVGGGEENLASADHTTVSGGHSNMASGQAATVPGGESNLAQGAYSFAAGRNAQALHTGAFVWADSGGSAFASTGANQFMVRASGGITGTVAGGMLRLEPSRDTEGYLRTYGAEVVNVILGWSQNFAGEGVVGATISGGGVPYPFFYMNPFDARPNYVTQDFGTVGGGLSNRAEGYAATVSGGENNAATGDYATVAGGGGAIDTRGVLRRGNTASGLGSAVGGGQGNDASSAYGTIAGGGANAVSAAYGTVGGGGGEWDPYGNTTGNRVTDEYGTVSGGHNNQAGDGAGTKQDKSYATVGGGKDNVASGKFTTVGGGLNNTASFQYATVGGGWKNASSGDGSAVAGGVGNAATGLNTTIAGGNDNRAGGEIASVGGGRYNNASAYAATVGGGLSNEATGERSTVSGGTGNKANGYAAAVSGGMNNTASGMRGTIGGGESNTASGPYATVPGGYTNTAQGSYSLAAGRRAKALANGCFVWGDGTDADITCNTTNAWFARATGGVYFYTNTTLTSGVRVLPGASAWSSVSDRKLKENFAIADGQEVLERLSKIPITTWNYKAQNDSIRHMGPMAQDFYAAFGLGEEETLISTVDADGVALAAIQGLYEISKSQASRIQRLEAENAALEQKVSDLESRLAALEALVAQMAANRAGGGR